MFGERRLVIVAGQEGAGKTTIVRALLPYAQPGAAIDAEDVGRVNPWEWDDAFKNLLWDNVVGLVRNFWQAGYTTVIAGSFINDYPEYVQFRSRLDGNAHMYLVHLCASKPVRDARRIARPKPTSKEWRDSLDRSQPEDSTLGRLVAGYRYIRIDNSSLAVAQTVAHITRALPEIFHPG